MSSGFDIEDTIVAISTPPGIGAIGMIRLSGPNAIVVVNRVFSKDILNAKGYSLHFGQILLGEVVLDEVLVSLFRGPKSFTRQDVVEVSFHGSPYILQEGLQLFLKHGARLANAGEFTQRAYLNGAFDLAQAEAVADLIASTSKAAHQLAMGQMRGQVSHELRDLRMQLLDFTSLIELELDFGEEDVEFADRGQFLDLIEAMRVRLRGLIRSFHFGNAVKSGVPTVIMGRPNAGKSTLLNQLLQDDRAIVSEVAGTTRDVIEDRLVLDGIEFRLMDTAGIRVTEDLIEKEGVARSEALAEKASLVLYVFDPEEMDLADAQRYVEGLDLPPGAVVLFLGNKVDLLVEQERRGGLHRDVIWISARDGLGMDVLCDKMVSAVRGLIDRPDEEVIISNVRHVEALRQTLLALDEVAEGIAAGLPSDLMTIDIRMALHYLGGITGEISTDEVLGNIFGKFCIGK
ncbi:MAG TPA: tRNA uridine-5-carboxymethylaminomethyl(34) synthesis GTPase MnmE [Bacteroidetes bacterium]|nr:tRNA uridine-5-carboxymethylaminomethyl(34) synthesis GTPase MnmE [Bacteroidota bacterium]